MELQFATFPSSAFREPRAELLDHPLGVPDYPDSPGMFQFSAGERGIHRRGGTGRKVRRLPLLLPEDHLPGRETETTELDQSDRRERQSAREGYGKGCGEQPYRECQYYKYFRRRKLQREPLT